MHFTLFILLYYFTVFYQLNDFLVVLPRLWYGFSKMSIHESFLVVLMFLTLIRNKKIFLNTLGSSSFSFFLLLDTLYTLWVLALFS